MELLEFKSSILKRNKSRKHKIINSLGIVDSYKWIKSNNILNYNIPKNIYCNIIKLINKEYANLIANGDSIKLPHKFGNIELIKFDPIIRFEDGKLKTNLPIDWNKTLELWYEDPIAKKDKKLIRIEEKEVYKIYYNKKKATYKNKGFYKFIPNRQLKINLKSNIKEGLIDALYLK